MTEKKLIAVVGATGAQGGGLVRAILGDPSGEYAVRALTRNPDSATAKDLAAAGDHLTGHEYAAALTGVLGEQVTYEPLTWEQYRELPFPLATEFSNMFQFYAEDATRFTGDRDVAKVRALNPDLESFAEWLARNAGELKAVHG